MGGVVSLILTSLVLVTFINNCDRWYNLRNANVVMYTGSTPRATSFENYTFEQIDYIPFIRIESAIKG